MTLQTLILKLLLKLPVPVKLALSGGRPFSLGGRTLDPALQLLSHGASKRSALSSMTVDQARQAEEHGLGMFSGSPLAGVSWRDVQIPSRGRHTIPVRIYQAETQDPTRPALTYLHMGGGVIGGVDTCHDFCQLLARRIGCPIVSVDYRLAPEHKFPAGLEDSLDAYDWTLENAAALGAPAGRAMVGGDSMGGNFSAVIAQEMVRLGKPQPDLQLLIYPATDFVTVFPSRAVYGETFPLSSDTMSWFKDLYLPDPDMDQADPRLSPAQTPRLEGLAPAIIATAGFDPLVDDGLAYARKLDAAGNVVHATCFDSLVHGFTGFMAVTPAAREACETIADMVLAELEQHA